MKTGISYLKWVSVIFLISACSQTEQYYSAEDFYKVPKTDSHFHYLSFDEEYLQKASDLNFRLLSPNVNSGYSIDEQLKITAKVLASNPHKFAFFGTFSLEGFGEPGFTQKTIERIDKCLQEGATGIKIWKDIGMVLKDSAGRYVMVDDPRFDSIFNYLEKNHIPVLGHLGEPRDCWLPFEEMTDQGDVSYYRENPQYHMYLHPEAPSYEDQINARDNLLRKHPKLDFIAAHLASLEYSVDEMSKRLDEFPNLKMDMAARIYHLQNQSKSDREKVRNFMIKYQDRILYATDYEIWDEEGRTVKETMENLEKSWMRQWIYMATDSVINVKGLKLPKEVIDKIYFVNSNPYFK